MDKKEQTRLRVQRYREKKASVTALHGSVTSSTSEALQGSVTQKLDVPKDVTQYPALLYALADSGVLCH